MRAAGAGTATDVASISATLPAVLPKGLLSQMLGTEFFQPAAEALAPAEDRD